MKEKDYNLTNKSKIMKYRDHKNFGLAMPHMDPSILMFKKFT